MSSSSKQSQKLESEPVKDQLIRLLRRAPVELWIALVLLGGCVGLMGTINFFNDFGKGNIQTTMVRMGKLSSKAQEYRSLNARLPSSLKEMMVGMGPSHLNKHDVVDAWSHPFGYQTHPQLEYIIVSPGEDGDFCTCDDNHQLQTVGIDCYDLAPQVDFMAHCLPLDRPPNLLDRFKRAVLPSEWRD